MRAALRLRRRRHFLWLMRLCTLKRPSSNHRPWDRARCARGALRGELRDRMKKKAAQSGKKVAKSARKEDVWYAYGIVRDAFDAARAPGGLDDTAVRVLK